MHIEKLGTTFFASSVDEENYSYTVITPINPLVVSVQGTVTAVYDEEFTLNNGERSLTVEVEEMPFNPLDNEGFLKIEVGDFVNVSGKIDKDLFEGRELVADSIIEITD